MYVFQHWIHTLTYMCQNNMTDFKSGNFMAFHGQGSQKRPHISVTGYHKCTFCEGLWKFLNLFSSLEGKKKHSPLFYYPTNQMLWYCETMNDFSDLQWQLNSIRSQVSIKSNALNNALLNFTFSSRPTTKLVNLFSKLIQSLRMWDTHADRYSDIEITWQ